MPKGCCLVRGCSTKEGEEKALFSFPKNLDSAKIWADACHRTDILSKKCVTNFKVCELHFEQKWFSKTGVSRKRLLPNAVPTVFDHVKKRPVEEELKDVIPKKVAIISDVTVVPPKDTNTKPLTTFTIPDEGQGPSSLSGIEIESLDVSEDLSLGSSSGLLSPTMSTQTLLSLSARTPRKEKLRRKIKTLEGRRAPKRSLQTKEGLDIEDFNNMCDQFLGKTLAALVKSHAVLRMKKPLARRYSGEIKQCALALYFLSPKAYRYLSRLMTLPDKRTLERLTQNLTCKPGLDNANILKALELKLKTMLDQDKHCVLCIDEMAIKSNLFYDTAWS